MYVLFVGEQLSGGVEARAQEVVDEEAIDAHTLELLAARRVARVGLFQMSDAVLDDGEEVVLVGVELVRALLARSQLADDVHDGVDDVALVVAGGVGGAQLEHLLDGDYRLAERGRVAVDALLHIAVLLVQYLVGHLECRVLDDFQVVQIVHH